MHDFANSVSLGECLRKCNQNNATSCNAISYYKDRQLCMFFKECDSIEYAHGEDVVTFWNGCEEPNHDSKLRISVSKLHIQPNCTFFSNVVGTWWWLHI